MKGFGKRAAGFGAAGMLALLAACSGAGGGGQAGEPAGGAAGGAAHGAEGKLAAETAPASIEPLGKYAPPIGVTVGMPLDSTIKFTSGETIENNVWTKTLGEQLGIDVKYAFTATLGEQYDQKVNVNIASNDLPDIMRVNEAQLKQLVEVGAVEDLTEAFDKYATPWLKSFYSIDQGRAMSAVTFGGKLMAFPGPPGHLNSVRLLWIRQDWLKNVGLTPPKTMQDLLRISEAFAKQDPDQNGKADTFGIGTDKSMGSFFAFMNGYHAYPQNWIKDSSGKLAYGSIQPEVKQALAKLQELYKDGQIDREFGVKDGTKLNQDIAAGKIGIIFGAQGQPLTLRDSVGNSPGADWLPYPIPSVDDKPARPITASSPSTLHVVKKGFKHPEAVVKMANFYAELVGPNARPEDYDKLVVRQADDGKGGKTSIQVFQYAPVRASGPDKNLRAQKNISAAMKSGDTGKLTAEEQGYLGYIREFEKDPKNTSGWAYNRIFGPVSSWSVIEPEYIQKNLITYNEFTGVATETMAQKQATLLKMEMEIFTKIIMGASPIDQFDTFVSDWKKLGGDQITKEVNDWAAAKN